MSRTRQLISDLHLDEVVHTLEEKTVPHHRSSFWYYLGGLTLLFFIVQTLTGVLLLFYYEPSVAGAHKSVERIMTQVPFGWIVRSVHSWGANVLIGVMLIHMFSTFFMKSYRMPRYLMWLSGIVLLLLMLGFGFTGYLLPWDETAYFATKIGTEVPRDLPIIGEWVSQIMKGAEDVSGPTLTRLFALHVAVLPILAILLVGAHSKMIALFGVSTPIGAKVKGEEKYFRSYLPKEMMVWLIGFGILIVIAVLYPTHLGTAYDLANPSEPPEGVHPEWYFMFLFQALRIVPEWAAMIGFGMFLVFWTLVPFLDKKTNRGERSPMFTIIGCIAILVFVGMTIWAYATTPTEAESAVKAVDRGDVYTPLGIFIAALLFMVFSLWLYRSSKKKADV